MKFNSVCVCVYQGGSSSQALALRDVDMAADADADTDADAHMALALPDRGGAHADHARALHYGTLLTCTVPATAILL